MGCSPALLPSRSVIWISPARLWLWLLGSGSMVIPSQAANLLELLCYCVTVQTQCIWSDCRWSFSPLPGTKPHKKKPSHDLVFSTSFLLHPFLPSFSCAHSTNSSDCRLQYVTYTKMNSNVDDMVKRESQSKSRLMLGGLEAPATELGTWEMILKNSLGALPSLFTLWPYNFLSSAILELIIWEWGNRILLMVEFQKNNWKVTDKHKEIFYFLKCWKNYY